MKRETSVDYKDEAEMAADGEQRKHRFGKGTLGNGWDVGPMTVPTGRLESALGITNLKVVCGHSHFAVVYSSLSETA